MILKFYVIHKAQRKTCVPEFQTLSAATGLGMATLLPLCSVSQSALSQSSEPKIMSSNKLVIAYPLFISGKNAAAQPWTQSTCKRSVQVLRELLLLYSQRLGLGLPKPIGYSLLLLLFSYYHNSYNNYNYKKLL